MPWLGAVVLMGKNLECVTTMVYHFSIVTLRITIWNIYRNPSFQPAS